MNSSRLPLFFCGVVVCALICPHVSAATVTLKSMSIVTGSATVGNDSIDYYVYYPDISRDGGPGMFSISSDGESMGPGVGGNLTLNWVNGTPTSSGSTSNYDYYGVGSGFGNAATYIDVVLTMPATSGTFRLWIRPVGNGSSISYTVTVKDNESSSLFSQSYDDSSDSNMSFFEFNLSGFSVNDTVTLTLDNMSGSNSWCNMGMMGVEFVSSVPEPTTLVLLASGAVLLGLRQRRK